MCTNYEDGEEKGVTHMVRYFHKTDRINCQEWEEEDVARMIEFFYTTDYCDGGGLVKDSDLDLESREHLRADDICARVRNNFDVYRLAKHCDVALLKVLAASKLGSLIRGEWESLTREIIQTLWTTDSRVDDLLRTTIAQVCAEHMDEISKMRIMWNYWRTTVSWRLLS